MRQVPLGSLGLHWFLTVGGRLERAQFVSFGWSMLMLGVKLSKLPSLKERWEYRQKQKDKLDRLHLLPGIDAGSDAKPRIMYAADAERGRGRSASGVELGEC